MQCYSEQIPPSVVTHALRVSLISPSSNELVIARNSLLQIFSSKTVTTVSSSNKPTIGHDSTASNAIINDSLDQSFLGVDIALERSEQLSNTKLVLITECTLAGTVTSVSSIKTLTSKTGGECLLISFKDAKLSLLEWDPHRHCLFTVSIHLYEKEDLNAIPWALDQSKSVSYITADPSSRCVALKFGVRHIAILPFRQAGDEDLVLDDYDADEDAYMHRTRSTSPATINGGSTKGTPYGASFVLPLTALDPALTSPIHLSFLYEYREPTFGVLFSSRAVSTSLLYERRDLVRYSVFTLDLEQRASTTILSVSGLPYDLHTVIPLPLPVGGALLVGNNELIHVDQAGRTNGVAVNMFAKVSTSFGLADQADLDMRLEGCVIEKLGLETGEMLIILESGELANLNFKMDGRSVSGLAVQKIARAKGGSVLQAGASCAVNMGNGRMFIGSEETDAVVLGWSSKSEKPSTISNSNRANYSESSDTEDDIYDDDDDLYGGGESDVKRKTQKVIDTKGISVDDLEFRIHDTLICLGPIRDLTLGKSTSSLENSQSKKNKSARSDLEILVAVGTGRAGGVAALKKRIEPTVIGEFDFAEARGVWSVKARRPVPKTLVPQSSSGNEQKDGAYSADDEFDRFLIVSKYSSGAEGSEESAVYSLTSNGFEEVKGTEFDGSAGGTIEVGTSKAGTRVVQVLREELRIYDGGEFTVLFLFAPYPFYITTSGLPLFKGIKRHLTCIEHYIIPDAVTQPNSFKLCNVRIPSKYEILFCRRVVIFYLLKKVAEGSLKCATTSVRCLVSSVIPYMPTYLIRSMQKFSLPASTHLCRLFSTASPDLDGKQQTGSVPRENGTLTSLCIRSQCHSNDPYG
jgi:cleavage and polyadenylation specificity factor subunit 1